MTTFGLQIPAFAHEGSTDAAMFEHALEHVLSAERSGFESVWVMDHFWQLPPLGGPDAPSARLRVTSLASRERR